MNERIRELWLKAAREDSGDKWDSQTEFIERFAKLIVRECADICNEIYFDRYPAAEEFERSEEGDAIKKHFGLKND